MRQALAWALASSLVAPVPVSIAQATELPLRKAGLWEMKVVTTGAPVALPAMTIKQCTNEAVDKELSSNALPIAKQSCSKQDIQKTATGYVGDHVCSVAGVKMLTHVEVVGDFDSAYRMKITSRAESGAGGNTVMTTEAKWIGACKPDQKPGDTVMPGGFKINVNDKKLKALLPK
jgi:hypothetical protein